MTRAANMTLAKWTYHSPLGLVTARERVEHKHIVEALDWAVDKGLSDKYYIYSGVHGTPDGLLQLDDDKFYRHDLSLIQDSARPHFNNPRITVVKKEFTDTPERVLIQRVLDPNRLVIMGWCFSEDYYRLNRAALGG